MSKKTTAFEELKVFITQPRTYFNQMKEQNRLRYALGLFPIMLILKIINNTATTGELREIISMGAMSYYFFGLLFGVPLGLLAVTILYGILHKIARLLGGKGTFKSFFTCNLLVFINLLIILYPLYFLAYFTYSVTLSSLLDLIYMGWNVVLSIVILQVCHELSLKKSIISLFSFGLISLLFCFALGILKNLML